jgi:para-nitrobenzyl esterase
MTLKLPKHLLISSVILMSLQSIAWAENPVVTTTEGQVIGKMKSGIAVFRGIPYAKAPIGDLRWHAPLPHDVWATPIKAFRDGSECMQPKSVGKPQSAGSEDCLSLNIWAPPLTDTPAPVMVFIHGGFYVEGSSDAKEAGLVRAQSGQGLASQGQLVVVSFNYRLGVMGFLASPALNDGSPESQSGNFGLMDQIAALKWVQENIAAFGGDPKRVTVFGQSAGASSILTLLASPMTDGLFSQAIIESGYLKAIPRTEAFEMSAKLVKDSNCEKSSFQETAQCLRALSPSEVIASVPSSAREGSGGLFVPNQDGWIIPEPLDQAYSLGHVKKIPVVMGTNTDEATSLATSLYGPAIKNEDQFAETITMSYGAPFWEKAKPVYENASYGAPQKQLVQLATDSIFTCPISTLAREHAPLAKTWRYVFNHHIHFPIISRLGAFHGAELLYVFGSVPRLLQIVPTERHLSTIMRNYWASFARNGDPNIAGQPEWPGFQVGDESALQITEDNDIQTIKGFRAEQCAALGL